MELARTDIFQPGACGARCAFGCTYLPSSVEGAAFEYTTLQGADTELKSIQWFILVQDFLFLALPSILYLCVLPDPRAGSLGPGDVHRG